MDNNTMHHFFNIPCLLADFTLDVSLTEMETAFFAAVILVWAGLLLVGLFSGESTVENPRQMPRFGRLTSSFTLVAGGWAWFIVTQDTRLDTMALWFAIGMTCGFVGDVFLARKKGSDNDLLYGIISFALGHIAYVIGMVQLSQQFDDWSWKPLVLLFWWGIGAVGWFLIVFWRNQRTSIHYAALPYTVLLANTGGVATVLSMHDASFTLIAIGAGLFLLSDTILAAKLFRNWKPPLAVDWVWLTYGPGQMLIVFGVYLYLTL